MGAEGLAALLAQGRRKDGREGFGRDSTAEEDGPGEALPGGVPMGGGEAGGIRRPAPQPLSRRRISPRCGMGRRRVAGDGMGRERREEGAVAQIGEGGARNWGAGSGGRPLRVWRCLFLRSRRFRANPLPPPRSALAPWVPPFRSLWRSPPFAASLPAPNPSGASCAISRASLPIPAALLFW